MTQTPTSTTPQDVLQLAGKQKTAIKKAMADAVDGMPVMTWH